MSIGNRNDDALDWREPHGEGAGIMLNQDCDKSLKAAQYGPVDDDRAMFGVICANVFQVEILRLLVVELDRGALPAPADCVRNIKIDFRTVESAILLVERVHHFRAVERRLEL